MRDRHHVLHFRQEWSLRPEAKKIREHPSLIPTIERETHNEIHANCPPVPLLGYYALKRVVGLWTPQHDTMKSIDALLVAIQETNRHPRAHPLESQLGALAMEAIELQRPFISSDIYQHPTLFT